MSLIPSPPNSLPSRNTVPPDSVTVDVPRVQLHVDVDGNGEGTYKLIRQGPGGDWSYVQGGQLTVSTFNGMRSGELVVANLQPGTVYNVVTLSSLPARVYVTGLMEFTSQRTPAPPTRFVVVAGVAAAGPVVLTGAKAGVNVAGVVCLTDDTNASGSFESTITVADQIQQTDASDLSAKKYALVITAK